jgi:hypothetical protein
MLRRKRKPRLMPFLTDTDRRQTSVREIPD